MRTDGPIPVLILVLGSDPEDDWQEGLSRLQDQFWGREAIRFVVAPARFDHNVVLEISQFRRESITCSLIRRN